MTLEMGKPLVQAKLEVDYVLSSGAWYAQNIEKLTKPTQVKTEAKNSGYTLKPQGTVFKIAPFNYPFVLPFKCAIPNLTLGNTV